MGSGAKDHFHAFDEIGVAIVVCPEGRSGFFRVDKADGNSGGDEFGQYFEEGYEATPFLQMHVFDVGGRDP